MKHMTDDVGTCTGISELGTYKINRAFGGMCPGKPLDEVSASVLL